MPPAAPSWFRSRSRAANILLAAFLAGAPLALALSFQLHRIASREADFRIELDRQGMIGAARAAAARLRLDTTGWQAEVKTHINAEMVEYFRRRPAPQSEPARRLAPEVGGEVLLVNPARDAGFRLILGAGGLEISYRILGSVLKPAEPIGEDEMIPLAIMELRGVLPEFAMEDLGLPEITVNESAGVSGVRRITFRPLALRFPEIQYTAQLDFLGPSIIAREITASPAEPFVNRVLKTQNTLQTFGNTFRLIIFLFFVFFAAFRFSRRIADGEAPVLRAAALACAMPVFGVALFFLDPALSMPEMEPRSFAAAGLFAALLAKLLNQFIQGITMGMGYGGGEGYIREAFPGKLVSLDAVLKGKLFSSNVAQALLAGAAAGCWLTLLYHLLLPLTGNPVSPAVLVNTAIGLSKHPWFFYFVKSVIVALFAGSVCLLVPLLLYRRLAARPRLLLAALFCTALLIGSVDEAHSPAAPDFWLRAAVTSMALVGAFFFWDFLAALAACASAGLLVPLADMLHRMPAWSGAMPLAAAQAALTFLPLLYFAFRGKAWSDRDLLPRYARVQAERLALQAELSAAREAQLRLLPQSLPQVEGVSLAAACIPAREVAGDFYDFIELDDGGLCVIVAEGGNDGLASALTIALAKGFLLFEGRACRDAGRSLHALEQVLGENLRRESGATSIALLAIEPAARRVTMARVGAFPRILAVTSGGVVRDAALLEDASVGGVAQGSVKLNPGDSLVVFTDGLARLSAHRGHTAIEDLLRQAQEPPPADPAASLHDALLAGFLPRDRKPPAEMADDITLVVISLPEIPARGRTEVA